MTLLCHLPPPHHHHHPCWLLADRSPDSWTLSDAVAACRKASRRSFQMPPSFASACRGISFVLPKPATTGSTVLSRAISSSSTWYSCAYTPLAPRLKVSHGQGCSYALLQARPVSSAARAGASSILRSATVAFDRSTAYRTAKLAGTPSAPSRSLSSMSTRSSRNDVFLGGALSTLRGPVDARQIVSHLGGKPTIATLRRAFEDLRTLLSSRLRRSSDPQPASSALRRRVNAARRQMPRVPTNPMVIILFLLALNTLVILGWQYALYSWRNFKDPRPYIFMAKNFLSGELNLREGRLWTLLTACISHEDFAHFALNMVSLSLTASPVMSLVGSRVFLSLYFGAGVASSLISMGWHRFVDPWVGRGVNSAESKQAGLRPTSAGFSHGASGSVYAIMATFACLMPNATFLIFFVIPAPAWACMTGVLGWDLYSAWFKPGGRTDSAGHIGGVLAGVAFWRFGLRGMRIN